MIEAGVGISTERDSYLAGKEAAKESLSAVTKPKLAILAVDHLTKKKFNYSDVLKGVHDIIGNEIPLIGSTVNGILVNDRFALKSVGLMLLGGDINVDSAFEFGRSRWEYKRIANDIYNIGNTIEKKPNQAMLMFQDGIKFPKYILDAQGMLNSKMVAALSGVMNKVFKKLFSSFWKKGKGLPSVQELLEELYKKGFTLPIIGNMATNLDDYISYEFFGDKVLEDSILGAIISGNEETKFGYGFAAGAIPTGETCKLTKNIGNFLLKIDDKPALEGFCQSIDIDPEITSELKSQGYVNTYQMLGFSEKMGDKELIHLTGTITDPSRPNLIVSGFPFDYVPETMEIFQSNLKIIKKTTVSAIEESIKDINDPQFLLGIDCIIRLNSYGDNLPDYIKLVRDTIGKDVPRMIVGSGGEIFGTPTNTFYMNNVSFATFAGGN